MAKGFHQTPGLDFLETFNPVVKASTIRVIFSIAVSFGWQVEQVDINNAFINRDLTELVYMSQPEGFVDSSKPSHVCQLYKSLYGLKQTPRSWFHKLRSTLVSWGFKNSVSDTSLFIKFLGSDCLFIWSMLMIS